MLKIENLKKTYGKVPALDGLNMTIKDSALYGFVGPNGAGKTTTIKVITGLLLPDSGKVSINGIDAISEPAKLKESIGYVPDFFGVYDNLKVSEYMEFFASCYGLDGLSARRRYMELLGQVGLDEKIDFYVEGLSRGMKQKLCLARALIHNPVLLIMDEPTSGLDPRTRYEFKEILKELREQGKTVIISSHILSELSELCTDIGIIEQGKILLEGSMDEILSRINISNPLIISLFSHKDTAMMILKSHPDVETITIREEEIIVGFSGDRQDEANLLQQLVDAGVLVYSFVRERGNLESVFMQITDHEEDEVVLLHEN